MTDDADKTPVEHAVEHAMELFVYAPIGLLFEGASLLPQLVDKGKSQVSAARLVGRYVVKKRGSAATKAAAKLRDQAAGVLDFLGDSVTPMPADPPPAARERNAAILTVERPSVDGAASLAIPDYDGLSASQVVNRLAGLSADELASVQAYESAHRGRKTILSKIVQLQGT